MKSISAETNNVLHEVAGERIRQEEEFKQQNHAPERYLAILAEEFGEVAKEVVEFTFSPPERAGFYLMNMRKELIQTAATAVAFVECIDRGEYRTPEQHFEVLRAKIKELNAAVDGLLGEVADRDKQIKELNDFIGRTEKAARDHMRINNAAPVEEWS